MTKTLTLDELKQAVAGHAAAFRCVTDYQPAGGPGDKIFPPTYEGGKYATEIRHLDGQDIPCVLVDSVQSQANRMELALLEARRANRINLPLITVRFDDDSLLKKFSVSSLEAPHRIADAILRDSLLDGVIFRKSGKGRILDNADARNATGLFGLCPTALVFGLWDSTGPRGGQGAKFQRALVSEMIGLDAVLGVKTASRSDPAQISASARIYEVAELSDAAPDWTTDPDKAKKDSKGEPILYNRSGSSQGKPGNPSKANHSNVTPSWSDGGFTVSKVRQTTVLSLAALRRLRFPLEGASDSDEEADRAARTVLAALGLTAATLSREEGADLRSRCQLFPTETFVWQLLDKPGTEPKNYIMDGPAAVKLLSEAIDEAKKLGLPWEGDIHLIPHPDLVSLVRKSQVLAAHQTEGED